MPASVALGCALAAAGCSAPGARRASSLSVATSSAFQAGGTQASAPAPAAASGPVSAPGSTTQDEPPPAQLAVGSGTSSTHDPNDVRIAFLVGSRRLDEDVWSPVEDQLTIGFELAVEQHDRPFGWELAAFTSSDDSGTTQPRTEARTWELSGGLRKTFLPEARVQPYLGAGAAVVFAEAKGTSAPDDDLSLAAYAHGGALLQLGDVAFVGADLRTLFGSSLELAGQGADADYVQLALVIGWLF